MVAPRMSCHASTSDHSNGAFILDYDDCPRGKERGLRDGQAEALNLVLPRCRLEVAGPPTVWRPPPPTGSVDSGSSLLRRLRLRLQVPRRKSQGFRLPLLPDAGAGDLAASITALPTAISSRFRKQASSPGPSPDSSSPAAGSDDHWLPLLTGRAFPCSSFACPDLFQMASPSSSRGRRPSAAVSLTPPPRSLNVQKFAESRAAELEALHAVVAGRTGGSFRVHRSKRRRTTSHVDRFAKGRGGRKRRRLGEGEGRVEGREIEREEEKKKLNRRVRRRMELRKNLDFGFSESGDGTQRLRTHLWHAKRFTMVKRWGFYLPLGLHGRTRFKGYLEAAKFWSTSTRFKLLLPYPIRGSRGRHSLFLSLGLLTCSQDSLFAVLRAVLVPSSSDVKEGIAQPVTYGMCYGRAMLHHIGASLSRLIAPVVYMWRPTSRVYISLNDQMVHGPDLGGDLGTLHRQLWIWVHAAAFTEGFGVLSAACQKQMNEDGVLLSCVSLKGKLAKLEVMGSEATQILQKILHPASELCDASEDSSYEGDPYLNACSSHNKKILPAEQDDDLAFHKDKKECLSSPSKMFGLLGLSEHLPSCAIISLEVLDPRSLSSKKGVESVLLAPSADPPCDLLKEISKESNNSTHLSSPDDIREKVVSFWSKPEEYGTSISDSKDLWMSDRLQPPVEDSILCLEKHHQRLKYFHLHSTNSAIITSESQGCNSRTCSVLLLKHNHQTGSHQGWSIILPLSWVKSFWIPLVSYGAHAIGLRERHWVASDGGIPCFPFDFPDCKPYSMLMSVIAAETNQSAQRRPLSMRPPRIPIPPPWDCIRFSVAEGLSIMGSSQCVEKQQERGEESAPSTSAVDSQMEAHGLDTCKNTGLSFQGCVARTSNTLAYFLRSIHCRHLLMFPKTKLSKSAFSELVDKEVIKWVPRILNKLSPDRPLCFTRVLLHSYREGIFEEGAVVCAPITTDLEILASRSEEPEKLQIPHSLATSYFTQEEDSDRWVLQVPDDPSARPLHRWPIGFVTSGFVRGSAKPVALAVCEVTLLAQLRERQWSEMQKGRPEVLVLVRNLRSTAYRLSRATIVLEQEDDLTFM
ncbi:hypothetical protein Taro_019946 [Colocasia esculenta]|uniref:Uncharacterized protein n=1 Tax=Colocasia esculenta TaxID=4460 RepID=A0A843UXL2_COLES|nr:hypothetical protein [Colocasia esculenta]